MPSTGEFKKNFNQLGLLLWKNYVLQKRSIIGTILELLLPAFFAIILLPIRGIVKSNNLANDTLYRPFSLDPFPTGLKPEYSVFNRHLSKDDLLSGKINLKAEEKWCLGYAPQNNSLVNDIMLNVGRLYSSNLTVYNFSTEDLMVAYVTDSANYAGCLGGITFLNADPANFTYKIRLSYSPRNVNTSG